jgi:two-component system cell cycle sensor histidine kinase/response regulator CckA
MSVHLRRSLLAAAAAGGAVLLTWALWSPRHFVALGGVLLLYVLAVSLGRTAVVPVAAAVGAVGAYAVALWPGQGGPAPQAGAALVALAAAVLAVIGSAALWRARAHAGSTAVLALERRYRRLVDHNLAGVLCLSPNGEVTEANDAAAQILGCRSRADLLARNVAAFFPEKREWLDLHARVARDHHLANLELCFRRPNGALVWAQCNFSLAPTGFGVPAGTIEATLVDLTARKQAEDVLRARERRFRALIENSADAIALVNAKGDLVFASDSTQRVLGYTPKQFTELRLAELIHPEDLDGASLLWRQALDHPGTNVEVQYRARHADGGWRWIEATFCDLSHTPGVRALVVNYRDVSERKALEQQLRQSQKMEAMGRLAGGIAHDFNNLLTVITGYSDIALLRLGQPESLRKPLEEIKRAGERAAGLTRQLLAFSRQQALAPQVVNLNHLVEAMEQMLRPLIGEAINISLRLGTAHAMVRADPAQIEQMLLNLAVNARDAMPNGGALILTTGQVEIPHGGVDAGRPAPGRYVLLCVEDTGTGMPAEVQSRIFEPFFTTKERGKGTGLGLAMVYGIMRQSGGFVEVKSEPGKGSQFFLYFPWMEGSEAGGDAALEAAQAPASATILVAEDEDGVRSLVRDTLAAHGFQVLEARDGQEALKICAEHPGRIDLLLTDVVMPNLDGRRLAERLHAVRPETKILFMSGFADPQLGDNNKLGPFLQKPFAPDAVPTRVRELLES